jgi:hypothetical protein
MLYGSTRDLTSLLRTTGQNPMPSPATPALPSGDYAGLEGRAKLIARSEAHLATSVVKRLGPSSASGTAALPDSR